ncbi:diphosphomevalonate decarboxylase [Fructobacillus sp. M1-13]|uniref:diphosphomevalonate decarboxylase n=1 Tax=Fructobacillus papyriferae TaxID=2713171 RepID=A0ABS5QS67_9LACO|nr:diphosphomevalonate decarboxylase [Fructobacillus papyriferae]MBS9334812.1 diphosphomevalonate decarboxylase [Fructobacillus papyriferae]MCD2158802.1 diphosphomevalonate decarboxylase [Fructobacillus papyriferae]
MTDQNGQTAIAHTNIAFIKYWGKADLTLNLPTTSSLSLTLNEYYTKTRVEEADEDSLLINDLPQDGKRIHQFLDVLRAEMGDFPPLRVISENKVPLSAGLASSASSFAALTAAVAKFNHWDLSLEELSRLSRRGSGSATRSFFAGFAIWEKGDKDENSYAHALKTPDLPIALVVCKVSGMVKKVSSSDGMRRAQTSPDYQAWVDESAKQLDEMKAALAAADIKKVGEIAEANALAMHNLNLTAEDRRFTYLNQETVKVLEQVKALRKQGFIAYATMDAGPNVKIITKKDQAPAIKEHLAKRFRKIQFDIATAGPGISYE